MKKTIGALLVAILVFSLIGCGNSDKANEGKQFEATIGIVVSDLDSPFYKDLIKGAKAKAEEVDVNIIELGSQKDTSTELNNVQELISDKVDYIIINPVNVDMAESLISIANQANIPMIMVNAVIDNSQVACNIISEYEEAGRISGEYINKKLNGKGVVIELIGNAGEKAASDKSMGFNDSLKDSEIKIIEVQAVAFNKMESFNSISDLLSKNTSIDGIFAHDDQLALGAVEALKGVGKTLLL